MTAPAPEAVDLADLSALDFQAPVLCDITSCHTDKLNAETAVAVSVASMPCGHVTRTPTCAKQMGFLLYAKASHCLIECLVHDVTACAHEVITFEPLP